MDREDENDITRFIDTVESFKFMGANFLWIVGLLLNRGDVSWWMCRFSVSLRKLTLSKYVFLEDVNS